jgi:glycosyltransferase involved in cell wall biosynthesis
MRILFFTLVKMISMEDRGIYSDMVKEFVKKGHHVDYHFPYGKNFSLEGDKYSLNGIKINFKIQKTNNFISKYFSYKRLESLFSKIIIKSKFDYNLLIIVTPSIFQTRVVKVFKKKYINAKTLLLLKDIFPDNALDLGILSLKFPRNIIYKIFKATETRLYELVDKIGCMTELNSQYLVLNNYKVKDKVFISPNSINPYKIKLNLTRSDLGLPADKIIVTFVGNLGLPQNPIFIRKLIDLSPPSILFLVIGDGSLIAPLINIEIHKLRFINKILSQDEIDQYLINSDYGLVVLSAMFKIPNFPSKILSYLNANIPLLAFTNEFNDLKYLITNGEIVGHWQNSGMLKESLQLLGNLTKFTFKKNNKIIHPIFKNFHIVNQVNEIIEKISN